MQYTRFINFANNTVALRAEDEQSFRMLHWLFGDVMTEYGESPCKTIRLFCRNGKTYHVFCDDEVLYIGETPGNFTVHVMDRVLYNLADKSSAGLVLHSGAVCRNGQIVLLAGNSGSGKSSLSAWLSTRGFGYLTDEMVFLPEVGQPIETFTRPINIKTKGFDVVSQCLDVERHRDEFLAGAFATLVPHRSLNANFNKDPEATLGMVIFPKFRQGGDGKLLRLSIGQSAQLLMEVLVNARNLEGHGIQDTISLAKRVPAYSFDYSTFGDVSDQIIDRLGHDMAPQVAAG